MYVRFLLKFCPIVILMCYDSTTICMKILQIMLNVETSKHDEKLLKMYLVDYLKSKIFPDVTPGTFNSMLIVCLFICLFLSIFV